MVVNEEIYNKTEEEVEQPDTIKDNEHTLQDDKSVDIFNALSLYHKDLGTAYELEGYNPLGNNFKLTTDFTNAVLEAKQKGNKDIFPENFLEFSNKEISKYFANSINNTQSLISMLEQNLSTTDEKLKQQIKMAIIFVKNRNQLLKMNIAKLKQKDANALRMYMELYGMDSELSELLRETFNEKANIQFIFQAMLNACQARSRVLKQKIQEIKIQQQKEEVKNIVQEKPKQKTEQKFEVKDFKLDKEEKQKEKPVYKQQSHKQKEEDFTK